MSRFLKFKWDFQLAKVGSLSLLCGRFFLLLPSVSSLKLRTEGSAGYWQDPTNILPSGSAVRQNVRSPQGYCSRVVCDSLTAGKVRTFESAIKTTSILSNCDKCSHCFQEL